MVATMNVTLNMTASDSLIAIFFIGPEHLLRYRAYCEIKKTDWLIG